MNNEIHLKPFTPDEYGTIVEQLYKITEEVNELDLALIKGDQVNAIEEFYDVIQASLGALILLGIPMKDIIEGETKHFIKLLKRHHKFQCL